MNRHPYPNKVQQDLQKIRDEFYTKLITGEIEFEAGWSEFVAEYRKAGYDTLEVEVQEFCRQVAGKCRR